MRNRISVVAMTCVALALGAFLGVFSSGRTAQAASVTDAVNWAIAIAGDDTHGYSQEDRWGPDYDCSSFVISAFNYAGFDIASGSGWTGNMQSIFTAAGFTWIEWDSTAEGASVDDLQYGDILWRSGHTEIYMGDGQIVGAHSAYGYTQTGDQTGKEICTRSYYSGWTAIIRYGSATTATSDGTVTTPTLSVGDTFKKGKCKYVVTGKKTVTLKKFLSDTATTYNIPNTVKKYGVTYKVTAVGKKAFKDKALLTKVKFGTYIKTIEEKAFIRCTSLKKLVFKGKKLKTVEAKAFRKIYSGYKIKAPTEGKLKKYTALIEAAM
ncbi:MAG: leucine-rich repeat protein [Eubacterium sp.]|nr:leucine-rich repeat protein [Eubacterium sp.]